MLMDYILDYLLKEREIIPTEALANKIKRHFIKQYELTEEELEKFDSLHSGHPVQIVNEEELENKKEWKLFL